MRWVPVAVSLLSLACPRGASAQGPVDAGVAAYERGDFTAARAAFAEAEQGEGLDRTDLLRLLATRALIGFADGQSEAMLNDLTALASLEPDFDLGPRAPPAVREALEEARAEALGVSVTAARTDGGALVTARVEGDRAGLTRRLRLGARAHGPWRVSEAGAVTLRGDELRVIAYYAEVLGPGGAVLVANGSRAVPQRVALPRLEGREGGGADGVAIGLGVGAGVLAVVAAVVIVALVAGDQDESVGVPRVEWP